MARGRYVLQMTNRRGTEHTEAPVSDTLAPNQITSAIIGAAIEVHRHLGPGFLESIYEEALVHELRLRNISFTRQVPIRVAYKGLIVGESRIDLLVANEIVVELKATERTLPIHHAQLLSYLKMTDNRLGLLINFNVQVLRDGIKRMIWDGSP